MEALSPALVLLEATGGVNGGGKVDHWGDGMVDHQHGGGSLGRESWRQNQGMGADWVVELVRRRPGRPGLGAWRPPGCA